MYLFLFIFIFIFILTKNDGRHRSDLRLLISTLEISAHVAAGLYIDDRYKDELNSVLQKFYRLLEFYFTPKFLDMRGIGTFTRFAILAIIFRESFYSLFRNWLR